MSKIDHMQGEQKRSSGKRLTMKRKPELRFQSGLPPQPKRLRAQIPNFIVSLQNYICTSGFPAAYKLLLDNSLNRG